MLYNVGSNSSSIMRLDKLQAIQLRKEGKSYLEISNTLGISKSTLSNWFSGVVWSEKTKNRLAALATEKARVRMTAISHRRRAELVESYNKQKITALREFPKFKKDILFIAGLVAYWREGDNKLADGVIRIANTDPLMVRLFYRFLKKYMPEISDRAKMYLVLYPDLNDHLCKQYWSSQVGLPLDKFFKSSYIKGKCPTKRLSYGIGTLTISSRLYKEKVITWIDLFKKEKIV